jgi:hypothetical protein
MGIQEKMERLRALKVETNALFDSISEGVRKAGWRGGKEHLKIMGWIDRLDAEKTRLVTELDLTCDPWKAI